MAAAAAENALTQVLVVHRTSFMTADAGARSGCLRPGMLVVAQPNRDAYSAAGEHRACDLIAQTRASTDRLPRAVGFHIKDDDSGAVAAWAASGVGGRGGAR